MCSLFTGNYDELIHFIFQIYDCDNDGEISREDVQVILSYLPLKLHGSDNLENFNHRIDSQEEIHKYVSVLFEKNEYLEELEFKKLVTEICSEPFIYVRNFINY